MRYAALVSFAETGDFGPYHVLSPGTRRPQARLSDETLYALASYIYSLKPPHNPNAFDEKAEAGEKTFAREGCSRCHVPPLYTSNKLTRSGFTRAPRRRPWTFWQYRSVRIRVSHWMPRGRLPQVPSLRVWCAGIICTMDRRQALKRYSTQTASEAHAGMGAAWELQARDQGHLFGSLKPEEREQLIAFLRALANIDRTFIVRLAR
jgi:hypothetical protein